MKRFAKQSLIPPGPWGKRRVNGIYIPKESWKEFLLWLRGRGLSGARLITGDKSTGMLGALEEVFPEAKH